MLPSSIPRLSPTEVAAELIALSVVEHTNSEDLEIVVELGDRHAAVTDSGRGMQISPDAGESISHAEKALTSIYPVVPDDPKIHALLTTLVWGERGSLGPAVVNASCPELRFSSRRDGQERMQIYEDGVPLGPAQHVGPAETSGTTVRVVTSGPIDRETVHALANQLLASIDGLNLTVVNVD